MKKIIIFLTIAFAINAKAQVVSTLAGGSVAGSADGTGTVAGFYYSTEIAFDGSGNLYVADWGNNEIRKIVISSGVVTTIAGSGAQGHADGTGIAVSFNGPAGIACDGSGNLYIVDEGNNEIRKIVISSGVVTTIAGSLTPGFADGTGTAASFYYPVGITCDGNGNLYVADQNNNEIRKIVISSGVVTTIAGSTTYGSADGTGISASFYGPTGIVWDGRGNLYVADQGNNEIRKIVISSGVVTNLAGSTACGSADGTGIAARFNYLTGIAYDGSGNLYVADWGNNEIRKIVISSRVVTTIAGSDDQGHADGTGIAASFNGPAGITCDGSGNIYVSDQKNNEIRKITTTTTIGIKTLGDNSERIFVYPNPSNGIFAIETNENEYLLTITNILGEKIYQAEINNQKSEIDLSKQPAGIYFVKVYTGKKTHTEKIIIQ